MASIVLDANVVTKWFLAEEDDVGPARRLLVGIAEGALSPIEPAHLPLEVAHALVRAVRRGRADATIPLDALRELDGLGFGYLDPLQTALGATEIAQELGIAVHAAGYLALYRRRGGPAFTSDRSGRVKLTGRKQPSLAGTDSSKRQRTT